MHAERCRSTNVQRERRRPRAPASPVFRTARGRITVVGIIDTVCTCPRDGRTAGIIIRYHRDVNHFQTGFERLCAAYDSLERLYNLRNTV